jgi:hypothetical protein
MKRRVFHTKHLCKLWKIRHLIPHKNELHCFSSFLNTEPAISKIPPPYILEMDQFHCMEAKCIFKPPSTKIANSVFNAHGMVFQMKMTQSYTQFCSSLYTILFI